MDELVDPYLGDNIYDLASGTIDFLIDAFE